MLHACFERFELFGADALDADADGGLLADDELILRFVPLIGAVLGEGAGADRFGADPQGAAAGDELAVEAQFGFEMNARWQWVVPGFVFCRNYRFSEIF